MAYSARRPIYMSRRIVTIFALTTAFLTAANARPWKSADGTKSFEGEFVKRDQGSVTINKAGDEVTIELVKLHDDDKKWLEANHPLPGEAAPDPSAFFDTLTFSDTRESALKKLKESKIVEMSADETFISRTGLNGVFHTRKKIGKVTASLYFDWNDDGSMKELTLQTDPIASEKYQTDFEPSWKELVELISSLYGKASAQGPMPTMESIPDGAFLPSHMWRLEGGGSALLGTARDGKRYQLVVRFTKKKVEAVEVP